MKQWWLSFCDSDRPKGQQFLGVAIVCAHAFTEAITAAHVLGINPGGEVQGHAIPPDKLVPSQWVERLLTRAECEELERKMIAAAAARDAMITADPASTPTQARSICCPRCNRESFNPNDITQRYCGSCHDFHQALSPERDSDGQRNVSRAIRWKSPTGPEMVMVFDEHGEQIG